MAILNNIGGTFELTPLTPTRRGPRDAYRVRICEYGEEIFNRQYNVTGWQAGHSEVYQMGKAFAYSRRLIDAKIPISLWREDSTDPDDFLPMQICLSVLWLEVVLTGFILDSGAHIIAHFYVWTGPDGDYEPNVPATQPLPSYDACKLIVAQDEAVRFGTLLSEECRAAQSMRRKLKITHYDDHLDFI